MPRHSRNSPAAASRRTRLDDVAKRAGVAKGTIYLYFRDKENLFQELIRAMLAPLIGAIEALGDADMPMPLVGERIVDMFVHEVYETRRKDVIRLIITRGPPLSRSSPNSTIARCFRASSPRCAALLRRAADRGEVPAALAEFPQLIAAPGLVAIIWSGLFERFEPLDVRRNDESPRRIAVRAEESGTMRTNFPLVRSLLLAAWRLPAAAKATTARCRAGSRLN